MVSVLPKAALTHEGLLLGEAHLVPHSPRRPTEDFAFRPKKVNSELASGPGRLQEACPVGPEASSRKPVRWVPRPAPGGCPVAPEVDPGSLPGGPEGQRRGLIGGTQKAVSGSLADGTEGLSHKKSQRKRPHSSASEGGLREMKVLCCP